MKIKLLSLIMFMLSVFNINAQYYKHYNIMQYRGSIEASYNYVMNGFSSGLQTGSIQTTHGFSLYKHMYVGIGAGIEVGKDYFAAPVYGTLSYMFKNYYTISPFLKANIGAIFNHYSNNCCNLNSDAIDEINKTPGFYLNISFGYRIQINYNDKALLLSAGYLMTTRNVSYNHMFHQANNENYTNHSLTVKLGFEF